MPSIRPLFRYSSLDAVLVLSTVAIVALLLATFLCFDQLSWWVLGPAFVVIAWSYCWNLQCIAHNFIHNPFFQAPLLNRVFSVLNSIALTYPDGTKVVPRNKDLILGVPKGTMYRQIAGGGGGYGDPKERDRKKVAEEVRNAVISHEAARDIYGFDGDGEDT